MLSDDIVLGNCYFWASRFCSKNIDFDALVSVGYIVGKTRKDPRLLKDWIKFTMLKYVMAEAKHRQETMKGFDSLAIKYTPPDENLVFLDLISNANLTKREFLCIYNCFALGLSQTSVAEELKITNKTVHFHIKKALKKLKKIYEEIE